MPDIPKLTAHPLRVGERAALKAALTKAELPTVDVEEPGRLFWRFENQDEVPVGFGGLEVHGEDALMRSLVTLPPVRNRGVGTAMVAALEFEARLHGCRSIWLITTTAGDFYQRRGYARCERVVVPSAIGETTEFSTLCPDDANVLMKRLTG
jgi:N-acetylglutamate synthase-like GNAT family acetyltransferase